MAGFREDGGGIDWALLKPDPLHGLLHHSDCGGELPIGTLLPLADRLEELLPKMPREASWGHIARDGGYRGVTERFIAGLRRAAEADEPVEFH
jgi:hypothetical protein